jgi:hypothetical protein
MNKYIKSIYNFSDIKVGFLYDELKNSNYAFAVFINNETELLCLVPRISRLEDLIKLIESDVFVLQTDDNKFDSSLQTCKHIEIYKKS